MDLISDCSLGNRVHEITARFHGLTVYRGDDVARLNSRFRCRAARLYILQDHSVGRAEFVKHNRVAALLFGKCDPDRAAGHLSVLDNLVVNANRHIGRQGESDAFVASPASHDGGIYTDDAAAHIH
jgi:hypothetical protein